MPVTWRDFQGVNAGYALELYDRFSRDPASVDEATRRVFESLSTPPDEPESPATPGVAIRPKAEVDGEGRLFAAVGASNLAMCIRRYGHLAAEIDPLGTRPLGDPTLELETHRVTEAELRALPAGLVPGFAAEGSTSMWDVIGRLRQTYCSTTGYDYAHIFVVEERRWLRDTIESGRFHAPSDPIDPILLLDRLTEVEAFERFLHRTFPGKTRFSIEGLDMLVPILDEVISEAAEAGIRQSFIGMAHRGRLNVMAHVMGKPYEQVLAEFQDPVRDVLEMQFEQWSGDVKYHLGASRAIRGGEEVDLVVSMPPNPSHLEAIDPVIEGMARAAGTEADRPGLPVFDPRRVIQILIHGDASFAGQGVVAETLNLHRLEGFHTGGTVHIIANNQIGFTTDPVDTYSTTYASGFARGFKIPIFHVNADDPEACVGVARLAFHYCETFERDVIIDLIGYRRHGHNEGDEPSFTQPIMYRQIARQPTVRQKWAATLEARGLIAPGEADEKLSARLAMLQGVFERLEPEEHLAEPLVGIAEPGAAARVQTAVPLDRLRQLNASLARLPEGFAMNRKLERVRARRERAFATPDDRTIDWALAEELAFASILQDGTAIRFTGEDVERGTFGHRHAVFYDVNDGHRHAPLEALPEARASFEIHNSPLTENAVVGFEFGYSIQAPDRLVIWEAQYGDFVNGAQVMLDEFVLSGRTKWGQKPSLVMLLPHAYEGQGPDHASARPERFLQLAADINLRLVNCTTAAQYFHVLRRQAALLESDPLPLVILSPKSLLRHPFVSSSPRDLAEGRWRMVVDDQDVGDDHAVRRLVLCSGKMAVDLLTDARKRQTAEVAVCRIEQLYPLPVRDIVRVIERYPRLDQVVWVQEEPENMGAWEFVRPSLESLVGTRRLGVLARPRSSSPAEGSAARHAQNQERLIDQTFDLKLRGASVAVRP